VLRHAQQSHVHQHHREVSNAGPDLALHVTLVDSLPDARVLSVETTNGTCVVDRGTNTLNCDLQSLLPGADTTVTITVRAPKPGTVTNTASVTALEPDDNLANNTAVATTNVVPR
jgi:Domain of unknown function DUF11